MKSIDNKVEASLAKDMTKKTTKVHNKVLTHK